MGVANSLQKGLDRITSLAGRQIIIRKFNEIIDPIYDDDITLSVASDIGISGVVMNLANSGKDSILVEQGKLLNNDLKLFTSGAIRFTGSDTQVKVIMGSATDLSGFEAYSVIVPSATKPQAEGQDIYNKIYLRRLTTGSLIGEV